MQADLINSYLRQVEPIARDAAVARRKALTNGNALSGPVNAALAQGRQVMNSDDSQDYTSLIQRVVATYQEGGQAFRNLRARLDQVQPTCPAVQQLHALWGQYLTAAADGFADLRGAMETKDLNGAQRAQGLKTADAAYQVLCQEDARVRALARQ